MCILRRQPTTPCWLGSVCFGLLILLTTTYGQNKNDIVNKKEKRSRYTPPEQFDSYVYWRRGGQAFFSENARDELRKLRNEMFARHGRKFKSEDLQKHFESRPWYSVNPNYHDSLLSQRELEYIEEIKMTESLVKEIPDGLKAEYEEEVAFRLRKRVDTTIVTKRDYTGNGRDEIHYTRIYKDKNLILVVNIIVDDNDTLLNKVDTANFSPRFFAYDELATNFLAALKFAPPGTERKANEGWSALVYSFIAKDVSEVTGKDTTEIVEEVKQYVQEFEGFLFYTGTSEASECGYIWYSPIKRFVTFYCP